MIAQFALRLACGLSLMWVLLPRDRITSGFFRIQMLVVLSLAALAAISAAPAAGAETPFGNLWGFRIASGGLAALAYVGSIVWTLDRRRAGTALVYAIAATSTALLLSASVSRGQIETPLALLTMVSELASALLMGAATGGMLLGHWYLTAPTMSIDPLSRANVCLAFAVMIRVVASLAGLWLAWPAVGGGAPAFWLALRWLDGILGPGILAFMLWRILKYRNTQAATGVLFVAVIVTFVGELSAALASRELHIPL